MLRFSLVRHSLNLQVFSAPPFSNYAHVMAYGRVAESGIIQGLLYLYNGNTPKNLAAPNWTNKNLCVRWPTFLSQSKKVMCLIPLPPSRLHHHASGPLSIHLGQENWVLAVKNKCVSAKRLSGSRVFPGYTKQVEYAPAPLEWWQRVDFSNALYYLLFVSSLWCIQAEIGLPAFLKKKHSRLIRLWL